MAREESPKILIIAGPNGAGKTTFAHQFLPGEAHCPHFVNADLIAAGLSPYHPEAAALHAGRLMLEEIDRHILAKRNFAFETTLAGRTYARKIPQWQAAGYRVKLLFLSLPSVDEALARVAERVRQGGHNIPEQTVRRRFAAGKKNFDTLYKDLVDDWALYDNSAQTPLLLDWKTHETQ